MNPSIKESAQRIRSIKDAAQRLRDGGIVAFPTETVYGLGANALDATAVARVFDLKGRPSTSPLIVHVASFDMARKIVREWPPLAQELAERWWPGPLTLVLPKQPSIPDIVTADLPTVGVRMPQHPIALELIRESGVPIAAPSANKFTGISPTTAEHVRTAFGDSVPVIDGGPCGIGIESTVVAIEGDKLTLLRPGMVSLGDIEQAAAEAGKSHTAPGMHERHYSPRTPVVLVPHGPADIPLSNDPGEYAAQLYARLHELDARGLSRITIEKPPDSPEWAAIRDRLKRAASKVE